MKNLFDLISSKDKPRVSIDKKQSGAYSISMDFEDLLLSGDLDSFSEKWVNKELERSKAYFYKQLKEA